MTWNPSRQSPLSLLLWALLVLGLFFVVVRFVYGLGAIANINDAYPWGWWIGFGVMGFISLGGCGFTIALLADIFGIHRFHPLVRPALVCGLLLYLSYSVILFIEIGRPWKAWILFFSWAPTSALYEIAWCATLYTTCLIIEFGKVVTEKLEWVATYKLLALVYMPVVVVGVTLSHFHQSSLGTMMTIVPLKVDDRWWSELLPITFLLTAYMAGLSLVTVEHVLATRWLRLKPRVDVLSSLAGIQVGLIGAFLLIRVGDLIFLGAVESMLTLEWLSLAIWLELVLGFIVPLALFAIPAIRHSLWGPFVGSCFLIFGNAAMRLNIAVFGMEVKSWQSYFPAVGEVMTTLGILAGAVLLYGFLLRHLPIHDEPPLGEADDRETTAEFARPAEAAL